MRFDVGKTAQHKTWLLIPLVFVVIGFALLRTWVVDYGVGSQPTVPHQQLVTPLGREGENHPSLIQALQPLPTGHDYHQYLAWSQKAAIIAWHHTPGFVIALVSVTLGSFLVWRALAWLQYRRRFKEELAKLPPAPDKYRKLARSIRRRRTLRTALWIGIMVGVVGTMVYVAAPTGTTGWLVRHWQNLALFFLLPPTFIGIGNHLRTTKKLESGFSKSGAVFLVMGLLFALSSIVIGVLRLVA
jgi:hypothetical protein